MFIIMKWHRENPQESGSSSSDGDVSGPKKRSSKRKSVDHSSQAEQRSVSTENAQNELPFDAAIERSEQQDGTVLPTVEHASQPIPGTRFDMNTVSHEGGQTKKNVGFIPEIYDPNTI